MTNNTLTKLIEKSQETVYEKPRDYIGASSIGADCLRKIWYEFKGYEAQGVPTRMRRTWAIGKKLEGLVIDWLQDAGLEIVSTLFDLKAQDLEFFQGHLDCVWIRVGERPVIIEIKTAKDASFKIFFRKGLKEWNYQYYCQVQSYMGMSDIHSAYILVLNKDNSELADELIIFEPNIYENLKEKAAFVYNAQVEPPRINGSPLWFQCKLCKYNKVCHK